MISLVSLVPSPRMYKLTSTEPEITLILSPLTNTPRQEATERGSVFLGTIPSIGDTLRALDTLCASFSHTLQQISDIGAELAAKEHIRTDNIQDVRASIGFRSVVCTNVGHFRSCVLPPPTSNSSSLSTQRRSGP